LAPVARRVSLRAGAELLLDDMVYFPVDGVATIVLEREHARFQVGFAGRGDVVGLQRLFMTTFPTIRAEVFKPGSFICVGLKTLGQMMMSDEKLKERLAVYALKSTAHFLDEAAETVALTLERRVARWIARCQAIIGTEFITVTHQELARVLGVRRSGVTVALHVLEGERLIRSKRGRVEVLDSAGLMAFGQTAAGHSEPSSERTGMAPSRAGPSPLEQASSPA
jgi:CRP-like cAMP-binding protein